MCNIAAQQAPVLAFPIWGGVGKAGEMGPKSPGERGCSGGKARRMGTRVGFLRQAAVRDKKPGYPPLLCPFSGSFPRERGLLALQ